MKEITNLVKVTKRKWFICMKEGFFLQDPHQHQVVSGINISTLRKVIVFCQKHPEAL